MGWYEAVGWRYGGSFVATRLLKGASTLFRGEGSFQVPHLMPVGPLWKAGPPARRNRNHELRVLSPILLES
jgi:hypothetical protein